MTIITSPPRRWATNALAATGLDVGHPTRVDPGLAASADGFQPGAPLAAQNVNYFLGAYADVMRAQFATLALQLREVRLEGSTLTTDTAESIGAVAIPNGAVAALKSDVSLWVSDWSRPEALAGVDSGSTIDGNVRDVARRASDGRLVAIGSDSGVTGGATAISTTDGATWATGTNGSGLSPHRIVHSTIGNRYVISLADDDSVWLSNDGSSAGGAFPSTGLVNGGDTNGLAVIHPVAGGEIIAILGSLTGAIGRPAFRKSTDGGATWSAGVQLGAGIYAGIGCLVGDGSDLAWWCGVLAGGASMHVAISGTATVWATVATLIPPAGTTFGAGVNPRILRCPDSGLMVIVAPLSNSMLALYASVGGSIATSDWVGPKVIGTSFSVNGFAIAGGRLFATRNDAVFASDGVLVR